jgi:hypothetical protein
MDPASHIGFQISTKSGRGPPNEHFWQVWLKSVQRFQRRRFKCEKLTDVRRTLTHEKSSFGLWPGELKKGTGGTYLLVFKILKINGIIYIKNYIKYFKVQTVPHLPLGISYKSSHNKLVSK